MKKMFLGVVLYGKNIIGQKNYSHFLRQICSESRVKIYRVTADTPCIEMTKKNYDSKICKTGISLYDDIILLRLTLGKKY